jgi:hypothetical protein
LAAQTAYSSWDAQAVLGQRELRVSRLPADEHSAPVAQRENEELERAAHVHPGRKRWEQRPLAEAALPV